MFFLCDVLWVCFLCCMLVCLIGIWKIWNVFIVFLDLWFIVVFICGFMECSYMFGVVIGIIGKEGNWFRCV